MRWAFGLTFILFLSSAMPAAATGTDWRQAWCTQFLDRVEVAIAQFQDLDEGARIQVARSHHLRHLRRSVRQTVVYCIRLLADQTDDTSRSTYDHQQTWELAWRR
ncbi:hypothetical protein [Roseicyclus sp.]|uniref:hypothetical protein n=1 Tax=Roseicyclus sp. TaxID=1914329 RepID=UPI003FA01019